MESSSYAWAHGQGEYREGQVDVQKLAALRAAATSARSADELRQQIEGARWVVSAWDGEELVGLARAFSYGITNAYVSSVKVDARGRLRAEVAKLEIELRDGRVIAMPRAAAAGGRACRRPARQHLIGS